MIKLVALDIDGTLLNREGQITGRVKEAIARLERQGVRFTLCTGRNLPLARPYAEELGISLPIATCNGAEIRRTDGQILMRRSLPRELAEQVYKILDGHKALYDIYSDDRIVVGNKPDHLHRLIGYYRAVRNVDTEFETLLEQEINRAYIFEAHDIDRWLAEAKPSVDKFFVMEHNPERLEAIFQELRRLPELCVTTSHRTTLEINHISADKGGALALIAEDCGLARDQVAAVGDGMNDVSMFQYAGTSFAMGNATDEVKRYAGFVTGANTEEGLAAALELLVPQPATKSYAVGVDIGGTKMLLFLADEEGNILDKRKVATPSLPTPDDLFRLVMNEIDASLADRGADRTSLVGVGIGLPGVVDFRTAIADNCTALGWGAVNVREVLQAYVDCPVLVENDVNISAVGEWWRGAAKGVDDFYMMAIGTGIGSAIISDGNLLRGGNFASGEIGYFLLDDTFREDFVQDYSTFGRLESMASGPAITARASAMLAKGGLATRLTDLGATAESVSADQVFRAAGEGDPLALEILRLPLRHLSMAIANVASLLNPSLIVIGGGVADSGPFLLDTLQKQSERLSPNPVKLVPAVLGNEAGAAGAVYLALRHSLT